MYSTQTSALAINASYNASFAGFWLYYGDGHVKVEEEYRLMDFPAIVSATGGSLGLFLGLSCYGVAWEAVLSLNHFLRAWLKKTNSTPK